VTGASGYFYLSKYSGLSSAEHQSVFKPKPPKFIRLTKKYDLFLGIQNSDQRQPMPATNNPTVPTPWFRFVEVFFLFFYFL
jgi:hypothetical protein